MVNCVDGINIRAISCCVPKNQYTLEEYAPDLFTEKSARRMAKGTGFSRLRIAAEATTTADLCAEAAEGLWQEVAKASIGALVFVTQTPDYILPATSHVLQQRLGLREDITRCPMSPTSASGGHIVPMTGWSIYLNPRRNT